LEIRKQARLNQVDETNEWYPMCGEKSRRDILGSGEEEGKGDILAELRGIRDEVFLYKRTTRRVGGQEERIRPYWIAELRGRGHRADIQRHGIVSPTSHGYTSSHYTSSPPPPPPPDVNKT
jgi:hypothetical protein